MKFGLTAGRVAVVASATLLAGLALGGAPANAVSVGAGAILATSAPGAHTVQATMSYDATPVPGGALVEFNCKAVASADPASTGLDTCSVNGQEAILSPNNLPGAASAAVGTIFVADGAGASGCVQAHAQFLEGTIGPLYVPTGQKCQPLILLRVA
jgi:hypothetical protein